LRRSDRLTPLESTAVAAQLPRRRWLLRDPPRLADRDPMPKPGSGSPQFGTWAAMLSMTRLRFSSSDPWCNKATWRWRDPQIRRQFVGAQRLFAQHQRHDQDARSNCLRDLPAHPVRVTADQVCPVSGSRSWLQVGWITRSVLRLGEPGRQFIRITLTRQDGLHVEKDVLAAESLPNRSVIASTAVAWDRCGN